MGTHSTIKFYNRSKKCILAIYNQYDGYITGEGANIYEFYQRKECRGNGFDDEALMFILYKKKGPYHTYATTEQDTQEYNYEIYDTEEGIRITIKEEHYYEEKNEWALATTLQYGTLDDLKHYIDEETIKEEEIRNSRQWLMR